MTERFHIGEWYGRPFLSLTDRERAEMSTHKVGIATMKKADITRLASLEEKAGKMALTKREADRLEKLRGLLEHQRTHERECPFRVNTLHATCTKPGGVCSLQLYTNQDGSVAPVAGDKGMLRALCPYRFHQSGTVFRHIGERLLGDSSPELAGEVGFLESTGNLDSAEGEDVGRIDMILVKSNAMDSQPMQWAAVEIQAVYFSGREMSIEFRHIAETKGVVSMAQEGRRPDYRSSGPKRLMPQLQIKVPTLRRWGKKMAIVVDVPFFQSMGAMQPVAHVSNADIVWFLVDFVDQEGADEKVLSVVPEVYTTLESSIEGLTGGNAVSLNEFEARIKSKTQARQVATHDV
jgi:Restriction endonuclease NotI